MKTALVTAVLVLLCQMKASSSRPNITISPHYKHIGIGGEVFVTCNDNAKEPLVGCEFDRDDYHLIDLSQGPRSNPPSNNTYHGTGLEYGDCGVKMTNFPIHTSRVDCRVRSKNGGWVYGDMKVQSDANKELHFESLPTQTHAMPGDTVRILHRLNEPTKYSLSGCRFILPIGRTVSLVDETKTSEYSYYGGGLKKGECGIEIYNISEALVNGLTDSRFHAQLNTAVPEDGDVRPTVWLIIAKPPQTTHLAVDTASTYTAGDTLTASCSALSSRPVVNITWLLGDDIIRSDHDDDSPIILRWSFPNRWQNITQNLTWTLKAEDDGKKLICRIQHFAMTSPGYLDKTSAAISVKKIVPKYGDSDVPLHSDRELPNATETTGEPLPSADHVDTCFVVIITLGSLLALAVCVLIFIALSWYTSKCCFRPTPPSPEPCMSYRQSIDDNMYDDVMNLAVRPGTTFGATQATPSKY